MGEPQEAVFILDDDTAFSELLSLRIDRWRPGIKILNTERLSQARRVLDTSEEEIVLVLLDQHLPDGIGTSLLDHKKLKNAPILALSADETPEVTANAVGAGVTHFLQKKQVSDSLFVPLIEAIISRKKAEVSLIEMEVKASKLNTIRTLVATLRHEINNPLGALMGGAYLLKNQGELADEQKSALKLIEESSQRINHVLQQICEAAELEEVTKGGEQVYQVPGDKKW